MLVNLCNNIIQKIPGDQLQHIFLSLSSTQKQLLSTILALDLSLDISLSLPLDEEYWKRKCLAEHWTHVNFWLSNCSWKNTFISHSVENCINDFISGLLTFSKLESLILCFQNYLSVLKVNGFKFNHINSNHQNLSIEECVFQLVHMFQRLDEIHLNNFPLNYEVLLEQNQNNVKNDSFVMLSKSLSAFKKLRKLHILGTQMKTCQFSCIIDSLIDLNYLVEVNLPCNLITDEFSDSMSRLLKCSNLETLNLSNNSITSIGVNKFADTLRDTVSLKTLHLDRNFIDDGGAINIFKCLVSNASLLRINLAFNKITSKCGFSLCMLFERNKILQCLNLTGNNLGKETGKSICKVVQCNNTVLYLGFQFCGFDEETEDLIHLHLSQNHQNRCQDKIRDMSQFFLKVLEDEI